MLSNLDLINLICHRCVVKIETNSALIVSEVRLRGIFDEKQLVVENFGDLLKSIPDTVERWK